MSPTSIPGAALPARSLGVGLRRVAGERRGRTRHRAARGLEFVFQFLVFAPQPLAFGFGPAQVVTQPFDLPCLILNDLQRVTGRRMVSAPRHSTVMADSRSKYKYEILDLSALTR